MGVIDCHLFSSTLQPQTGFQSTDHKILHTKRQRTHCFSGYDLQEIDNKAIRKGLKILLTNHIHINEV